jgi:3'-phosphoadenosine 5'-phosphosulfate sulfotransferase (PAPS reductase)/FAD synthetase
MTNPLYLQGMGRVGCMPCVMCGKDELREIARRFPDHIARIREWELTVGAVGRYSVTRQLERMTFFHSRTHRGELEASIDTAIDWSRTQHGGRQHDLLVAIEDLAALDAPGRCSSHYRLCE